MIFEERDIVSQLFVPTFPNISSKTILYGSIFCFFSYMYIKNIFLFATGISLCQVTMDSKQDNVRIIRWYMQSH